MNFPIPDMLTCWQFWITAVLCYVVCEVIKRIPYVQHDRAWIVNIVNLFVGALVLTAFLGAWTDPSSYLFGILASSLSTMAYEVFMNIFKFGKDESEMKIGGTE